LGVSVKRKIYKKKLKEKFFINNFSSNNETIKKI